jgi:PAS domain S-box-containing protein
MSTIARDNADAAEDISILHVDDPSFVDATQASLERERDVFTVHTETSARDALDRLATERIDCIVSGYDMSPMDGLEFLEAVRNVDKEIPFILFTGEGSEAVASRAISAGVTDYFERAGETNRHEVLANRIGAVVEQYRSRSELEASREQLSLFVDQSPLGVIEWDDEFDIVRLNDTAEAVLGYTETELEGQSLAALLPAFDRADVDETFSTLSEERDGHHRINETLRKDGSRVTCEWHSRVVTDDNGAVVAGFSQLQDATERKEHERHFQQVTENINEVIWMSDVDKDEMIYVNPAYEDVWGHSRESLYENPSLFVDAIHPEDRQRVVRAFSDQSEGNYDEEYRIIRPDGETRWIRDSAVPVRNADGEVYRIVGIAEDITEQKDHEQELTVHSEAIEAASDGIAILDEEGTYQFVNQAHAEMYGYDTAEELLGETWRLCYGEAELDRFERTVLPVLSEEGSWRGEATGRRADGSRFLQEVSLTMTDGGRIVCVVRDVTERKRREREVKRRQDLLRHTEELADTGGWELDAETETLRWTDGTRRIFDVSAEYEPTVSEAIEFYHPEDRETIEGAIGRALRDDDPFDLTLRIRTAAGRDRWVQAVGEPIVTDGDVTKVRGAIRNVTDQQRRAAALERQNDRLEAFAGIVSHDLRNPLNVADGRLSLARDECDSDHLDSIADALDRMAAIIDDTMTLARQGDTVGEMETVDLSALAAECWTGVVTDDATIEIVDDVTLRGDGDRVRHVLENFFRNAVEHTEQPVTVRMGVLPDGFYVEDDGSGVPEAERGRVFDPGYSTGTDDTGFGLAIVSEIVEAHGWSIDVTESNDGGARFEVTGVDVGT